MIQTWAGLLFGVLVDFGAGVASLADGDLILLNPNTSDKSCTTCCEYYMRAPIKLGSFVNHIHP
jgi:Zn-dependent alcohol dehydrogenase